MSQAVSIWKEVETALLVYMAPLSTGAGKSAGTAEHTGGEISGGTAEHTGCGRAAGHGGGEISGRTAGHGGMGNQRQNR